MIVSILQLMALPFGGLSARTRGENPDGESRSVRNRAINEGINRADEGDASHQRGTTADGRHDHAVGADARRREVKPQPKAKAKPAAKAKPQAKAAKSASKPTKAKPAAKKLPAKPAAKAAAKKPAAKAAPAKKATAKKAMPVKAAKPASKKPVPAPKKAAAKPQAKAATTAKAAPAKTAPAKPAKASAPAPAPAPVKAPAGAPARTTKPSARLAQLTVPSMAQTVTASTAPKASYTPTMSHELKPPPLVPVKKDPKLANNWKTKAGKDLSDEEVLAMPDSEYMNDKQMEFFRAKLQKLKEDILSNAGETTEHLREDTVIVPDPADRATIEEEHALELRTRDRERKLLKKIEQSIGRIDAGDYGYCDETGEPIGVGRLLARPTATLSLEAQQRRELKQKMFGD
jgi:DnaK suppressor protein